MSELPSLDALSALLQVVVIDLVLAGDNAVVIGLAAAGLPKEQRGKAIVIGIIAATVLRIIFALMTTVLLGIIGLLIAGGVLLLWVFGVPEQCKAEDLPGSGCLPGTEERLRLIQRARAHHQPRLPQASRHMPRTSVSNL